MQRARAKTPFGEPSALHGPPGERQAPWQNCRKAVDPRLPGDLCFTRCGKHLIVFVDEPDRVIIVDFLHRRRNLPARIAELSRLEECQMSVPTIDQVWSRIRSLEGQEFLTKTGKPFTYSMFGDSLTPSRTDYKLGKTEFAKALSKLPLNGPGEINSVVRGPAYVWAILHDARVRQEDW